MFFCEYKLELEFGWIFVSALSICPMVAPAPVVGDRRRQSRSWGQRPVRGGR